MKKTLILSCCAPCSAGVVEFFAATKRPACVLFYNPNIATKEEHDLRASENRRLCDFFALPFVALPYTPEDWLDKTKDFLNEPERGKRCSLCFSLRLKKAAEYAKANGFDCFTSVLGVSRYKNLEQVNACAAEVSKEIALPYDFTNWRKGGLEVRRAKIIKDLNLYSQKFCGCLPSKNKISVCSPQEF